jgi:hypothetical protein
VNSPANDLIALFKDKRINPHELAALVGAHSASKQFFVNTTRAGAPQDSTPGVWDVKFYGETLSANPPKVVFKFPSDVALSQHPAIAEEWLEFAQDQSHWNKVRIGRPYMVFAKLIRILPLLTSASVWLVSTISIPASQNVSHSWRVLES